MTGDQVRHNSQAREQTDSEGFTHTTAVLDGQVSAAGITRRLHTFPSLTLLSTRKAVGWFPFSLKCGARGTV